MFPVTAIFPGIDVFPLPSNNINSLNPVAWKLFTYCRIPIGTYLSVTSARDEVTNVNPLDI